MPFKSEKQRRYLWANEPEIARDWTDTYGNRIQAFDGGIMELALAQQARQMYALGQLVSKNKDGSRPGYRGPGGYQSGDSDPAPGGNTGGNTGGDPDGRNPMAQFDGSPVSDKGRKGVEDMRAGLRSAISAQNRAAAVDNFKTTLKNIFDKTLIGKGINMLGTKFGKTTAANLADRYGYATDYQGSLGPSSVDDDDDDMNENRGEGIIPILPKTFTDYYANVDQNLYDDDEETVDDVQDFIQRFRVGDAYRQKPGTIDTPIKYT